MQKDTYDHKKIEKKWQEFWKTHNTFQAKVDTSKPKYYVLDMFPYPSGAGLHVGHVTGYTGTDIMARYKRHKGFNVLHPMGWDSFGLPAEQYAIRTGTHPEITTKANIDTYRKQLQSLGFSYDWSREIATSDPSYYKWTQWIFTKLYEKGMAYEAEAYVNFCPALGTVLANEEVENGKSKEGGFVVERKPLKQWILKITAYADRLIEDLETADWPENIKKLQINWIGKSEGAKVFFPLEKGKDVISVFTTRPDTLFGVTYIVLSPEHPLVDTVTAPSEKAKVDAYRKQVAMKSDLERTDLAKDKTGVWAGSYVLHPITKQKVPIWIADYVLMGYGTGAVMAVPAHDERDFAFAKKFSLPVIPVYDPDFQELSEKFPQDPHFARTEILEGNRCWEGNGKSIHSSHQDFSLEELDVEMAKKKIVAFLEKEKRGEKTINYKIRDWLFSRQRYWGEPIPILHYSDGTKRILELDELPLLPPVLDDYKPSPTGESPVAKVDSWVHVVDTKTGKVAKRETNTMPQWAGSCWYYLRFCDPQNTEEAFSSKAEKYWMPVDLYVGGAEHAVLHLLYSRFWHKVLYDCGIVHTKEPFQTYRYQGIVTAPSYKIPGKGYVAPDDVIEKQGKFFAKHSQEEVECLLEKMSKSKLNGVTPDEMQEEFGADALRLYEMFMGPFDREKIWNSDAVNGCFRFLHRLYDIVYSDKVSEENSDEAFRMGHRLVDQVTRDIETMQFNTAIPHMMEFVNGFSKLPFYPKSVIKMVTILLSPFAPHLAEEFWEYLGEKPSIAYVPWPAFDKKYLVEDTCLYVVQVNGKVRGKYELPTNQGESEVVSFVSKQPQIAKYITKDIVKIIFVPNKLVNLVVAD